MLAPALTASTKPCQIVARRTWHGCFPLFLIVLCTHASRADEGHMDLLTYTQRALLNSDRAESVRDAVYLSELNLESQQYDYKTVFRPIASGTVTDRVNSQSLGLELNRRTEFGFDMSLGSVVRRQESDLDELGDSSSVKVTSYLRVRQGIFRRWGLEYNRFFLTRAEIDRKSADLAALISTQDIIQNAARTYFSVVLADKQVEQSGLSLTRTRANMESAKARQAIGLVSKVDVYRAEIAFLNGEEDSRVRQRAYESRLLAFRDLIRLYGSSAVAPVNELPELRYLPPAKGYEDFLLTHPEWQLYLLDQELADLGLRRAQRDLLPDMTFNFGVEKDEPLEHDNGMIIDRDLRWVVNLQLDSDFDRFDEKQQLSRVQIAYGAILRSGEALKRRLNRDLEDAFRNLQTEQRRLQLQDTRREQARKASEFTQIRYEKGLSDNLDVVQASEALLAAELDINRSQVSVNLAVIEVARALGVLDPEWLDKAIITQ